MRLRSFLTVGAAMFSLIFTGCATTHTKAWRTADGKDSFTVESAKMALSVTPEALNPNMFTMQVMVENHSAESVDVDLSNLKLRTESGEVLDQLTDQELNVKISGAMGFAGAMAGGSMYTNQAATSGVTQSVFNKMIRSGKLPAKSKKSGVVYFEGEKSKGNITVLVLKPLTDTDKEVTFQFKK